jgi:hypothetical protein
MNNPTATIENRGTFSSIFTNSTLIYLFIFLATYAGVYFILGIFYGGSAESGALRIVRMVDILVLLFIIIFIITTYWNVTPKELGSQFSGSLSSFKEFADNPYSIFSVVVFLLVFYATIYMIQIPMSSIAKPITVMLVEMVAIILFVVLLIIDFFKYILNVDLLDFTLDTIIDKLATPAPTAPTTPAPLEESPVVVSQEPGCPKSTEDPNGEVFNIRNNMYTYDEAREVCSVYGANLATYDQIERAYNKGAEWCNYGWSEGQMALFPTQKSTWAKLQNSDSDKVNNSCGRPGINGGVIKNPNIRFGVNCYGKKPEPSKSELALMKANMEIKQPETPVDRNLQAKMDVWKKHADKFLLVNSFNRTKWSE